MKDLSLNKETMSSLEIAELTGKQHAHVMSISEYTFSEDIGDMIDTLIRLSYEDSLDDNETMNKIRAMSCVRDFLMDIEKSRPKD
jgi:phage regulator Rha-like protein